MNELLRQGFMLSNLAFNLKGRTELTEQDRGMMRASQKGWDDALEAFRAMKKAEAGAIDEKHAAEVTYLVGVLTSALHGARSLRENVDAIETMIATVVNARADGEDALGPLVGTIRSALGHIAKWEEDGQGVHIVRARVELEAANADG